VQVNKHKHGDCATFEVTIDKFNLDSLQLSTNFVSRGGGGGGGGNNNNNNNDNNNHSKCKDEVPVFK